MKKDLEHDDTLSKKYINLAEERLGSKVLFATDDFFAEKENLIKPGRGIFIEDKYTDRGKWMDGWESRRKRTQGHDYCDVKLGLPGSICAFDIDTNHFLGNHPPHASVEACEIDGDPTTETQWTEILEKSPLAPGSQNFFEIKSSKRFTHIRLHIYPDGGVARLRVYGRVAVDWTKFSKDKDYDFAAVENGGHALICNDMFFSSMNNLIAPGRGINMGDGWETKRRREPGNDWVVLTLGHTAKLSKAIVDTAHFKGNYPDRCSLEACLSTDEELLKNSDQAKWSPLLNESKLEADKIHEFKLLENTGVSHVRMNIFPDGGVSRLRLLGRLND